MLENNHKSEIKSSPQFICVDKYFDEMCLTSSQSWLYIMSCEAILKIGVSKNPFSRLKQIQSSNPKKVKIIFAIRFCSCPYQLEKFLHKTFKGANVGGEWFDLKHETHRISNFILMVSRYRMGLEVKNFIFDICSLTSYDDLRSDRSFLEDASGYDA